MFLLLDFKMVYGRDTFVTVHHDGTLAFAKVIYSNHTQVTQIVTEEGRERVMRAGCVLVCMLVESTPQPARDTTFYEEDFEYENGTAIRQLVNVHMSQIGDVIPPPVMESFGGIRWPFYTWPSTPLTMYPLQRRNC